MGERDPQRVTVLNEVLGGGRTLGLAARMLGLSVRQVHKSQTGTRWRSKQSAPQSAGS